MSTGISSIILGLNGQQVKQIKLDTDKQQVRILCSRDRRTRAMIHLQIPKGTINRYVLRQIRDLPVMVYTCLLKIQLAQVSISKHEQRLEACDFVDSGHR